MEVLLHMKCIQCGKELTGEENFCKNCGSPIKKENSNDTLSSTMPISYSKSINTPAGKDESNLKNNENNSVDISESGKSDLTDSNTSYKIDNTQELLVDGPESSKKIKKILDELKLNKNEKKSNLEDSNVENSSSLKEQLKKNFEDNTKKIDHLIEKKQELDNESKVDSTVIVDTESIIDFKNENDESNKQNSEAENAEITSNNSQIKAIDENDQDDFIDDVYEDSPSSDLKSKNGKFIFILLMLILCLCFIAYLIVNTFDLNDKLRKSEEDYNILEEKINDKSIKNSNNMEDNKEPKVFSYNGYDFEVYKNLKIYNNTLNFQYKNLSLTFTIGFNFDFSDIKHSKDEYKNLLEKNNYKVLSYGTKVISDREYVFYEVTNNSMENLLIVYTIGGQNDVFMFEIHNDKNQVDYKDLEILNEFISLLKKSENTISNLTYTNYYFIKK